MLPISVFEEGEALLHLELAASTMSFFSGGTDAPNEGRSISSGKVVYLSAAL